MFLTQSPVQNIRLHEYVVLFNQMSGCGFYDCVPQMPKEHGMHRQVTRPTLFFFIKGSGLILNLPMWEYFYNSCGVYAVVC